MKPFNLRVHFTASILINWLNIVSKMAAILTKWRMVCAKKKWSKEKEGDGIGVD